MAKTKKELEKELEIYKGMYEKVHRERMDYLYILINITEGYRRCAIDNLEALKNTDSAFTRWGEGKELQKLINKLKRGV